MAGNPFLIYVPPNVVYTSYNDAATGPDPVAPSGAGTNNWWFGSVE